MNGITITINDKTKTASCRETVALCAKYAVTVSPALEGDGFLVLHRRHVGSGAPDGKTVFIGGEKVADPVYKWDMNEVYAVVNLTTVTSGGGVSKTTGELDLRYQNICQDFIQKYGTGANAPLTFAIYDADGGGLAGEGEFDVKVVEPYYVSDDQDLALFVGPKGSSVTAVTLQGIDSGGGYVYRFSFSDGTYHDLTCPRGPMGLSSRGMYALNQTTNKYHVVYVSTNSLGQLTLRVDSEGVDAPPSDDAYVTLNDTQTMSGAKTFLSQIIASAGLAGDVVGNVTGNVTGNVAGDVTGGVDATGDDKQVLVKKQEKGDNSSKAASTSFVQDALVGIGDEPLFTMRGFPCDMRERSDGIWVPLPTRNYVRGDNASTFLSKADFPDAYADLLARYNNEDHHGTSVSYRIRNGLSFNNENDLDYTHFSDTTEPCIQLGTGQMITTNDAFAAIGSDDEFEFVIRFATDTPSSPKGLITPLEKWHYKGEKYVDTSGNEKQYTADTLYNAEEYTSDTGATEEMVGKFPRFYGPSVLVYSSYFKVYASTNGTSSDISQSVNHGKGKLTAGTAYTAHIGRDSQGLFLELRDGNDENSGGVKRLSNWTGSTAVKFGANLVIGNSISSGSYGLNMAKIYMVNLKQYFNLSLYYTSENNVVTTDIRYFSDVRRTMILTSLSSSASHFTIDTSNEGFYLPVYNRRYNYMTGIDEIMHMRVK